MRPGWKAATAGLVLAISAVGFAAAVHGLFEYPYEDAFIHFRIARNLAEAGQPYFNLGERVFGDSSPLWMLILAAGFTAFGSGSYGFVAVIGAVSVAASLVLAYRLLAGEQRWSIPAAALAAASSATLVSSAGGGMEAPLAMALLTGAALSARGERWSVGGALLGLAAATRFELFPVAATVLLVVPSGRRLRFAVTFGSVATAEALALLAAYRTVIPNTMIAKSVVFDLSASEFWARLPAPWGVPAALYLLALALPVLAIGVTCLLARRFRPLLEDARALVLLGALPAVLAATYVLTHPMLYPWYFPLLVYPAVLGACLVALRAPRLLALRSGADRVRTVAVVALACAGPLLAAWAFIGEAAADVQAVSSRRIGASDTLTANARARTYLEIGSDLERRCPGVTVLAPEVGALGWTYRGRIVDGVGLVSPEVLRYHPLRAPDERVDSAVGAYPARAVAELQPDVVVGMQIFNTDFAHKARSDPSLASYSILGSRPVFATSLGHQELPGHLWGSTHVIVVGHSERCSFR